MIKNQKRLMLILVLFICFFMLFTGCARRQSSRGGTSGEISFTWWGDENRNAATRQAAALFEQANPGITVVTEIQPSSNAYYDKIIIQLASNTAPDLFKFSSEWMGQVGFVENPVLQDLWQLTDYIDFSDFNETLLSGGEINGRLLGVPTGISGWAMTYNVNVFNEFARRSGRGLPPGPGERWTIEEMLDYARVFKQTMGDDYSMLSVGINNLPQLMLFTVSEIAGAFYVNDRAVLQVTEQDFVQMFRLLQRYTDAGIIPAGHLQVEAFGEPTIPNIYIASGQWAGWFNWTSNIPMNEATAGSESAIMAYPVIGRPEFDGLFVRPAQFWCIASGSNNKQEAAQLLNFILNDAGAIEALELQRGVPPTERGQRILADLGILEGTSYESTAYLAESAASPFTPFILIPELLESLRDIYSRFILGEATAEASAATLYADWQRSLESIRRANGL